MIEQNERRKEQVMVDGEVVRLAERVRDLSPREHSLHREISKLEAKIAAGHSNLERLLASRRRALLNELKPDTETAA